MKQRLCIAVFVCVSLTAVSQTGPLSTSEAASYVTTYGPPPDNAPNTTTGVDSKGMTRTLRTPSKYYGFRPGRSGLMTEMVDEVGNRSVVARNAKGAPTDVLHSFRGSADWYDRYLYDQNGKLVFSSVTFGMDLLSPQALQLGIRSPFPDWLRIDFATTKTIRKIRLFSQQDNFSTTPVDPIANPNLEFTLFGVTDYEFQYWNGSTWVTPAGGLVVDNRKVLSEIVLPGISTSAIRFVIRNALNNCSPGVDCGIYTRVVEVEALDGNGINVAASVNGGRASASSSVADSSMGPGSAIDGDRIVRKWKDEGAAAVGLGPTSETVTTSVNNTTTVFQNAFAKVTRWRNNTSAPTSVPKYYPFFIEGEITEVKGKVFDVRLYKTFQGYEVWDNQGGARILTFNSSKKLTYMTDDSGDIVRIVWDSNGRPRAVFLGENGYIEYKYDDKGLMGKSFANQKTGEIYYQVNRSVVDRQNKFRSARQVAKAYLPGSGPVVEWDQHFGQNTGDGLIVASLQGQPYALIPLQAVTPNYNNNMPIRRVFTLFAESEDPLLKERIEYSNDRIIVQMPTTGEGIFASQHISAFSFPRYGDWQPVFTWSPATSASLSSYGFGWDIDNTFQSFADSPETPLAGSGDSSLKDNDDGEPQATFPDSIDVTTSPATLPFLPFLLSPPPPPGSSGRQPGGATTPPNTQPTDPALQQFPACTPVTGSMLERFEAARDHAATRLLNSVSCQHLFNTMTAPYRHETLNLRDALEKLAKANMVEADRCSPGNGVIGGCVGIAWTGPNSSTMAGCTAQGDSFGITSLSEPTIGGAVAGQWTLIVLHELLHMLGYPADGPGAEIACDSYCVTRRICEKCGPFTGVDNCEYPLGKMY